MIDGSLTTIADFERHAWRHCWENSHSLRQYWDGADFQPIPLITESNRAAFSTALQSLLTTGLVLEWIDDFARSEYLESALGRLPDLFIKQYFPSGV